MTQVRLEADVADALRTLAPDAGCSVAQLANRRLRTALGLDRPKSAPSERRTSTVRQPGHSTTMDRSLITSGFHETRCPHPLSRRIGNQCAACGATVRPR